MLIRIHTGCAMVYHSSNSDTPHTLQTPSLDGTHYTLYTVQYTKALYEAVLFNK